MKRTPKFVTQYEPTKSTMSAHHRWDYLDPTFNQMGPT
jgi:hypothetical protein